MRVIAFCAYYEPEIAASMYLLTNLFEDMAYSGIEVDLFAPTPTRGINRDVVRKYKKIKYEEKCNGNLRIHRFGLMQEGKGTLVRAFRYVLLNMVFICKGISNNADVLFIDSTPPTQGLVAAILKKIKKYKVLYNLQDIFPDSLVNTGLCKKDSLVYRIGRWIEKESYKNADIITVISEDFRDNIVGKGVEEDKIAIIYNWVDQEAVKYIPREKNRLFDEYDIQREKFYISYSGNIGFTQNLEMLIDAAKILKNEDVGFLIVGDGAYLSEFKKAIVAEHLDNITVIPFQSYQRIAEVFSLGDVGLIISKPGIGTNSVPSKTWSYMAAQRPILASFDRDSELCRILEKNHCGRCVDPNNLTKFVETIREMKKDFDTSLGVNGRRYIDSHLSRSTGTKKYINLFQEINEKDFNPPSEMGRIE